MRVRPGQILGEDVRDRSNAQVGRLNAINQINISVRPSRLSNGEITHVIPSLPSQLLDDHLHDVDPEIEVGLLLQQLTHTPQCDGGKLRMHLTPSERPSVLLQSVGTDPDRLTLDLLLTDLQEPLVASDEAFLPFPLSGHDLAHFHILLLFGQRTDPVSPVGARKK
jgi:hypothetical protein